MLESIEGTTGQEGSPDTSCHIWLVMKCQVTSSWPVVPSSDYRVLGLPYCYPTIHIAEVSGVTHTHSNHGNTGLPGSIKA